MKTKKLIYISFLSILSFLIPLNTLKTYASQNVFDFSKSNSNNVKEVTADKIVETILGEELIESEKSLLLEKGINLKYEEKIPTYSVSAQIDDETLTVHASIYEYVDVNNRKITWVPYEASISNQSKKFNYQSNFYECIFNDVLKDEETINITYQTILPLDYNQVNDLINLTYYEAKYYVDSKIVENNEKKYQEALQEYNVKLQLYNQYLDDCVKYEEDLNKYNNYLSEKKIYDQKKKAYDKYVSEYNIYLSELENYNQYQIELKKYQEDRLKYDNYLEEKKKFDAELAAFIEKYPTYEQDRVKMQYQLYAMELIKTPMTSLERTIYGAVMGSTVTTVLDRKSELVQLNVDPRIIDDAYKSTYLLREIFSIYFSFTTNEEKYSYYKSNYKNIKDNLELLLRSIDKLYRAELVATVLEKFFPPENRYNEKYMILIAQLAIVCMALDKNPVDNYERNQNKNNKGADVFSYSYIVGKKTILSVLENVVYIEDIDEYGSYVRNSYPDAPEEPKVVEQPLHPKEVSYPIEPTPVSNPGQAPEVVNMPTKPSVVQQPIEPQLEVIDEKIQRLIDDYNNQNLTERQEYSEDVPYTVNIDFNKKFRNSNILDLEFQDNEGRLISRYEVEQQSYVVFLEEIPSKKADEVFSEYVFDHWEYENGDVLDVNNVLRSGIVHPTYKGTVYQEYDITWIINEKEEHHTYIYGQVPSYNDDIEETFIGSYYNKFMGWNKEITPVTKNDKYEAVFEKTPLLVDNENNVVTVYISKGTVYVNYVNLKVNNINIYNIYKYIIKDNIDNYKINITTDRYTIEFDEIYVEELINKGIYIFDVTIDDKGFNEYYYCVNAYYDNGQVADDIDIVVTATFYDEYNYSKAMFYLVDKENEEVIRATFYSNAVKSSINVNKKYHVYETYSIVLSYPEDMVKVDISSQKAMKNEEISIETTIIGQGIVLNDVIIKDSNNNLIDFNDGKFIMPNKDVYVVVSCSYIKYTVNFIVNGETISTKEYKYGEKIIVPNDPIMASDENYMYKFVGWDKDVTQKITGNIDFVAVFESIPFEFDPIEETTSYILIAKVVAISFVSIRFLALLTMLIIKRKRIFRGKVKYTL